MNWIIIILGNLIMDSAIGFFAILAGLESRLHKRATMLEQEGIIRQSYEINNEVSEQRGPRQLTDEEIKAMGLRTQADKISPTTGNNTYYFFVLFIIGATLQVIGLVSE